MSELVESTTRKARDFFHFGLVFFGFIIAGGGVVMLSVGVSLLGALLLAAGLAFFLLQK